MKIAGKRMAGVLSSETQKDIIPLFRFDSIRRRRSHITEVSNIQFS
jgi:hypothetical protein